MMRFPRVLIIGLMLSLASCALKQNSLVSSSSGKETVNPNLPSDSFLPLRKRDDGKILASFQYKECTKRIVFCVKWQKKTIYFEDLEFFYMNGWGLYKIPDL